MGEEVEQEQAAKLRLEDNLQKTLRELDTSRRREVEHEEKRKLKDKEMKTTQDKLTSFKEDMNNKMRTLEDQHKQHREAAIEASRREKELKLNLQTLEDGIKSREEEIGEKVCPWKPVDLSSVDQPSKSSFFHHSR